MIDRLIIKRVEAMMMTRLKKKMRSTRNQKVDRKRRGIKRLVIAASRRSARVSKQSCGERTDVTATPRKGVRPGELRTNRGPPLSLSLPAGSEEVVHSELYRSALTP